MNKKDESVMSLRELQTHFSDYVMQGDESIKSQVVSTAELKSDLRLAIYANAYVARLIEALETDYSVLKTIMGDEAFDVLAEAYIAKYPSTYTSLRFFGKELPSFLQSVEHYKEYPHLYEMATLEWMLATSFNAADAPALEEVAVAQVPPEQWPVLVLVFHPAVQWFSYQWNIIALWKAAKEGQPLPELVKFEISERCAVWRHDLKTQFRTMDTVEGQVLPLMVEGMSFGDLCEYLAQDVDDPAQVPMQAAGLMKTWINAGLVIDLQY